MEKAGALWETFCCGHWNVWNVLTWHRCLFGNFFTVYTLLHSLICLVAASMSHDLCPIRFLNWHTWQPVAALLTWELCKCITTLHQVTWPSTNHFLQLRSHDNHTIRIATAVAPLIVSWYCDILALMSALTHGTLCRNVNIGKWRLLCLLAGFWA